MTAGFKRTDRIAEMIQRKLSRLIPLEVDDPRLPKFVTISGVHVSNDLSHAKIYFTAFHSDSQLVESVLNQSAPLLRKALSRTSTLRTMPQLHFIYDSSIEYGNRLSRLIDEINPSEDNDVE